MDASRAEDLCCIERLNVELCHQLDRGTPTEFAALFMPDARYIFGPRIHEGREAIRGFAEKRSAKGPRTSRHVLTGLRIEFTGPSDATGISICTTYAADGPAPIAGATPTIVADFIDRYARSDGAWLVAERQIKPIFLAQSHG